jgi:hypothetical protein
MICDQCNLQSLSFTMLLFCCTDKAPSPLVSLVGRKDYERCAHDIYFFLQASILAGVRSYCLLIYFY